jgi:peptidoglycan/LPS O-acetylase OafA/YrhL
MSVRRLTIGRAACGGRPCLDAGALGVDLFFVLSSFLITALLLREKDQRGTLGVRAFWMRRILRILPLYFSALAVVAIVMQPPWSHLLPFMVFLGNWRMTGGEAGYPTDLLWSVSIEEQFYLCWPLMVRFLRPRGLVALCLGLGVLAVVVRLLLSVDEPS